MYHGSVTFNVGHRHWSADLSPAASRSAHRHSQFRQ